MYFVNLITGYSSMKLLSFMLLNVKNHINISMCEYIVYNKDKG